jgi:hypothetical protein
LVADAVALIVLSNGGQWRAAMDDDGTESLIDAVWVIVLFLVGVVRCVVGLNNVITGSVGY